LKGVGAGQAVVVGDETFSSWMLQFWTTLSGHLVLDLADLQARAPTVDNEQTMFGPVNRNIYLRCIVAYVYVTGQCCMLINQAWSDAKYKDIYEI
jgi:hypothetical protein